MVMQRYRKPQKGVQVPTEAPCPESIDSDAPALYPGEAGAGPEQGSSS